MTLVQVETPDPGLGQVRITVEACGICHSDAMDAAGFLPGTGYEVAGLQILGGAKRIYGHASGTALDTEHTLLRPPHIDPQPVIDCWPPPTSCSTRKGCTRSASIA